MTGPGDEEADALLISTSCWLDDDAVAALAEAGRRGVTTDPHGRRVLHLPTVRVVEEDAVRRQAGLEVSLRRALDDLTAAGVDPGFVRATGASVRLSISLCPVSGQAGIVLAADMLLPWVRLGADVFTDAL